MPTFAVVVAINPVIVMSMIGNARKPLDSMLLACVKNPDPSAGGISNYL
jgi:hypothetical protein